MINAGPHHVLVFLVAIVCHYIVSLIISHDYFKRFGIMPPYKAEIIKNLLFT